MITITSTTHLLVLSFSFWFKWLNQGKQGTPEVPIKCIKYVVSYVYTSYKPPADWLQNKKYLTCMLKMHKTDNDNYYLFTEGSVNVLTFE